ncbi:hypothetical protein [Microbacterium immunditiarum]|uniref:Uncharacterized protein n=1 Tax=Microbacterium immunditiarum TaxID=337480 RepID=A0A7Y9GPV1_9MICO|nr:hypothetical protein [Microbacterium immunditiarum]NYE20488.1 hypothetical protein [Microbacterium immunditiarum]
MTELPRIYRLVTVVALVLWSALSVLYIATLAIPDPTFTTVSTFAFLCAQLALGVSAVGLGHLLRDRTPVLAPTAAGLLFVSAIGHAASAGAMLAAPDLDAASIPWSLNLVAIPTMIGVVGGTIVLAVALFRAKLGIAWLGVVLIGWVIVEFFLSGLGVWAQLASAALLIVGFIGLAVVTARSELRDWSTVHEWTVAARVADPEPAIASE